VLTFPCRSNAPETPREPSAAERERLAEQRLAKRLALWQDRLELKDWKISLVQSRRSDLRPGTLGNIRWDEENKTARIRVLDADEYPMPFEAAYADMEFTLVHELIHLELASLPRNDESRGDEEHAVNHMTDALLRLEGEWRPYADRPSDGSQR
jgi:hypothetical protein